MGSADRVNASRSWRRREDTYDDNCLDEGIRCKSVSRGDSKCAGVVPTKLHISPKIITVKALRKRGEVGKENEMRTGHSCPP